MDSQKYVVLAQEIAIKHGKELAKELVLNVVIPAVEEFVASTETKLDDMFVAALKDSVVKAVEAI